MEYIKLDNMRIYLLILVFPFSTLAENNTKSHVQNTLRSVFNNCRQHVNPGMAVSVVQDGQVVFSEAFGVKDLETKEPVTTDTLFGIGSLTKVFANLLIQKYFGKDSRFVHDPPCFVKSSKRKRIAYHYL